MKRLEHIIRDHRGLHAAPAARISQMVKEYQCTAYLEYGDMIVNMENVFELACVNACRGEQICITVCGEKEEELLCELQSYMKENV